MVIKATNLRYTIPYGHEVLKGIDFEVAAGQFAGILGRNGSGKTTLIDLILGNRPVSSGELTIFNDPAMDKTEANLKKIAFMSHEVSYMSKLMVSEISKIYEGLYPTFSREKYKGLLETLELSNDQKYGTISLGQQKKVQVAMCLSSNPDLFIVDEITAVFDPVTRDLVFGLLDKEKRERGATIILATNIVEDLEGHVDHPYVIKKGRMQLVEDKNILKSFKDEFNE